MQSISSYAEASGTAQIFEQAAELLLNSCLVVEVSIVEVSSYVT